MFESKLDARHNCSPAQLASFLPLPCRERSGIRLKDSSIKKIQKWDQLQMLKRKTAVGDILSSS